MERKVILGNLTVADIRNLIVESSSTIQHDASLDQVLAKINEDTRTRHVYVVDNEGKLVGAVRMNAVVEYLFPFENMVELCHEFSFTRSLNFSAQTAAEIMNPDPLYVYECTKISEVAKILISEKINELPVVDDNMKIIGQVNTYEIIQAYLAAKKQSEQ